MKKQKPHTLLIYFSRAILLTLSVFILFISLFIAAIQWTGSTREIVSVANKFRPPSNWRLEAERVEPPRIICIQDVSCPSVHRMWSSSIGMSVYDFEDLIRKTGWELKERLGNCSRLSNNTKTQRAKCSAWGISGNYNVMLDVSEDTVTKNNQVVVVNVWPLD